MIAQPIQDEYSKALAAVARPVTDPADFADLFKLIGNARIVMLGEASHGTSEFYEWRRIISEQLIRDHGFSFIAVEGDWPDCQRVHEHITQGKSTPRDALAGYHRFPTWMWGNEEVLELVEWMRGFNDAISPLAHLTGALGGRLRAGFHGLDVYSLNDSMRMVIDYLRRVDPEAAKSAQHAYACFEPYGFDPQRYAYATRFVPQNCERQVTAALAHMDHLRNLYSRINPDHTDPREAYFDATMNARVVQNAEAYYRTMLAGEAPSWNIRDRHMMETLELLLEHYGSNSRAIIWAHNTHIGDYRATDMDRAGYINIGGLAREKFGSDAVRLIGFGTHHGTVMAAKAWDDQASGGAGGGDVMTVPDAMPASLEHRLHQLNQPQLWLPLRDLPDDSGDNPGGNSGDDSGDNSGGNSGGGVRTALEETVGHRAIGVVYHPQFERPGNYVPTRLADRYDAFIFIDETQAVHPLGGGIPAEMAEEPEAWPSGL